jgi:hypothetical protein
VIFGTGFARDFDTILVARIMILEEYLGNSIPVPYQIWAIRSLSRIKYMRIGCIPTCEATTISDYDKFERDMSPPKFVTFPRTHVMLRSTHKTHCSPCAARPLATPATAEKAPRVCSAADASDVPAASCVVCYTTPHTKLSRFHEKGTHLLLIVTVDVQSFRDSREHLVADPWQY